MFVIDRLREKGYVALLAGGCVRDMLLGLPPKDYDVATDATPLKVAEVFPQANHVGAKFGVMLVRKHRHDVEVATFRSDGVYSDGRRPDDVTFGTDREDALRRDFTINGMFLDTTTDTVIDYVGGRTDLEAGTIRTIGDARERLGEDHLRMLRAIRFAARLGFQIEPQTAAAISELAPRLAGISPERIWIELGAILTNVHRDKGWRLLTALGLADHLAAGWTTPPELHDLIVARLGALGGGGIDPTLGMAALLCDHTADVVRIICTALRQSNREVSATGWLVASLPMARLGPQLELADLKALMAHGRWSDLTTLLRADLVARDEPVETYDRLVDRAQAIPAASIAPPPLLDGNALAGLGCRPGPRFGLILRDVYRAQRNDRISTTDEAVSLAKKLVEGLEEQPEA